MSDVSPTTNRRYYAGEDAFNEVKNICRSLNISEGKLSKITEVLVCDYLERSERDIDSQLAGYYYVPLVPYNLSVNGTVKSVYPGSISQASLYLASGLLLLSEFQGNEPNIQEATTTYIEQAKKIIFSIIRFNHRLEGQRLKSVYRTMPPTFQPPVPPEANF